MSLSHVKRASATLAFVLLAALSQVQTASAALAACEAYQNDAPISYLGSFSGGGNVYGTNYFHQQFTIPAATTLDSIQVGVYAAGAVAGLPGTVAVRIYNIGTIGGVSGVPVGSPIASGYKTRDSIDTNTSPKTFDLDDVDIAPGKYAFQVENVTAISSNGVNMVTNASNVYPSHLRGSTINAGSTYTMTTETASDFSFQLNTKSKYTVSGCGTSTGGSTGGSGISKEEMATVIRDNAIEIAAWSITFVVGFLIIKGFRWRGLE